MSDSKKAFYFYDFYDKNKDIKTKFKIKRDFTHSTPSIHSLHILKCIWHYKCYQAGLFWTFVLKCHGVVTVV